MGVGKTMGWTSTLGFGLGWLLLAGIVRGFYLPGISAVDYSEGVPLEIYADRLQSTKSQFPLDYYALPFCEPQQRKRAKHLNFGEILMGERDELTNIVLYMLADEKCTESCVQGLTAKQIKFMTEKIKDEFFVHLNVDNMPLVMKSVIDGDTYMIRGLPLGYVRDEGKPTEEIILYNHYKLKILYHKPKFSYSDFHVKDSSETAMYRIVGFEGEPLSQAYTEEDNKVQCPKNDQKPMILSSDPKGQTVAFTYDVEYEESEIEWATRWDGLLAADPKMRRVQWFSIFNSIAITIFLTALVAVVMLRTLYLDFARYNNLDDAAEAQEETGWKQVHGDVFRPPVAAGVFCICIGQGAQLCLMMVITLFFSVFGFFSPAWRGGLMSGLLLFWLATSALAGYVSARMYAGLKGTQFRLVFMGSAFAYSGVFFAVFFIISLVRLLSVGTGAMGNIETLLLMLGMWVLVAVPLNMLGSFLGARAPEYKMPTKTHTVHRPIPEGADSNSTLFVLTGGLMPFACIFIELSCILNSLWEDGVFYMFGFLFLVFIILAVVCAEVSIVMTYFYLSNEDYHWWWRAYFTPASAGLYVFIYSIIFLNTQQDLKGMHLASVVLYLGYTFLLSFSFSLLAGFIGFEASFVFIRKMFSSVKID